LKTKLWHRTCDKMNVDAERPHYTAAEVGRMLATGKDVIEAWGYTMGWHPDRFPAIEIQECLAKEFPQATSMPENVSCTSEAA